MGRQYCRDGNLAFTARLLRKVLGDNARTPIYIETIPRKGYRFIAEVSEPAAEEDPERAAKTEQLNHSRHRSLRLGLALLLGVLAIAGWFFLDRFGLPARSAPILTESFKAVRL